uniref:DDE_Tnp_1_7 domain-containing protein n=1 Tax=Steinernema glaseri TaxID=37863 RepID=A0A1I7ZC38_9BILA
MSARVKRRRCKNSVAYDEDEEEERLLLDGSVLLEKNTHSHIDVIFGPSADNSKQIRRRNRICLRRVKTTRTMPSRGIMGTRTRGNGQFSELIWGFHGRGWRILCVLGKQHIWEKGSGFFSVDMDLARTKDMTSTVVLVKTTQIRKNIPERLPLITGADPKCMGKDYCLWTWVLRRKSWFNI